MNNALDRRRVSHIASQAEYPVRWRARRNEFLLRAARPIGLRSGNCNALALRNKRMRNRQTDTACSASDQAHPFHPDRIVPVTAAVIFGAGELGGALARQLAAGGGVSKITLVDDTGSVAQGKALDIRQAGPIDRYSVPIAGSTTIDVAIDAATIVIADHVQRGEWQDDHGVGLIAKLIRLNQSAPVICAGAGQATMIERAVRELGVPRSRIFGTAPEALRSAIAALVALEAGCAATDVNLTVVGRPPHQIIVPWEDASIAGQRVTTVLTPPAITRLDNRVAKLWPPGPFTLASAATRAINTARVRTRRTISAFVAVSREEGALGRVAMLPIILAPMGVGTVVTPLLSARDRVRLETVLS